MTILMQSVIILNFKQTLYRGILKQTLRIFKSNIYITVFFFNYFSLDPKKDRHKRIHTWKIKKKNNLTNRRV